VLYELATDEPGFTVDGPVEDFGKRIILPPWLESRREAVESRLTPLDDPRADWPRRARAAHAATAAAAADTSPADQCTSVLGEDPAARLQHEGAAAWLGFQRAHRGL